MEKVSSIHIVIIHFLVIVSWPAKNTCFFLIKYVVALVVLRIGNHQTKNILKTSKVLNWYIENKNSQIFKSRVLV